MTCHTKVISMKLKAEEEINSKGSQLFGTKIENQFDELRTDIITKIDKELSDSSNARDYISQKYEELCAKIHSLTELDATVTGFRSDVRAIERQITELSGRVTDIEQKVAFLKESPSILFQM